MIKFNDSADVKYVSSIDQSTLMVTIILNTVVM